MNVPLLKLVPVLLGLSCRPGSCACPFDPCCDPSEKIWLCVLMGLSSRFPSLPALISLSPILNMHERLPCTSFLKLGLFQPADPCRSTREEDLNIFLPELSRAFVKYSSLLSSYLLFCSSMFSFSVWLLCWGFCSPFSLIFFLCW